MVAIVRGFPNVLFGRYRNGLAGVLTDRGVRPVRVIDVQETLESEGGIVFRAPNDWGFHTVSHTWSLEIRQLSEEVGSRVKEQLANMPLGIQCAGSNYEDVFRHAKLDNRSGYAHFVEFLKMLHADGVERIWFDALCINQTDQKEKAREIAHMGAYYYHSVGCYVVAHGFGRGFHMTDSNNDLPRWFSRVWTLQEMLLPRTLTFIVQLSSDELHGVVRSMRRDHVMGHCDCKGEAGSLVWPWGFANPMVAGSRWSEDYQERVRWSNEILPGPVQDEDEKEFWRQLEMSGYRCMRGRFQRVAYDEGGSRGTIVAADVERRVLYFVHIDAYVYILECLRLQREGGIPLAHRGRRYSTADGALDVLKQQVISELMRRFEVLQRGGHPAVVREISMRECSNEEDRVLAVLALLGLDGQMLQLRTMETLEEQMVQMCSAMAKWNPGGLITLCAAFVRPYISATTGYQLSWAPHFKAHHADDSHSLIDAPGQHEIELYHLHQLIRDFHHAVANVSVGPRGLSLSCHMLKGRLISSLLHAQRCTAGGKLPNTASKIGCCACSSWKSESSIVLHIAHGGHALSFNAVRTPISQGLALRAVGVINPHNTFDYCKGGMELIPDSSNDWNEVSHIPNFNVWLLLLGTFHANQSDFSAKERGVLVFMVCIGDRRDNLHKIGIVQMLPTYTVVGGASTIHLESFATVDCTVGAFRKRDYIKWLVEHRMRLVA